MTTITRGCRFAAPLLLAAALAACQDGPTSPSNPAPSAGPALNTSAYDAGTGTITLHGEDGLAYTLLSAASEIRVSDGTIIELSPSELVTAVNAFINAHEGGGLATALTNAPPPPTNLACELGWNDCNRNDVYGGVIGEPVQGPGPVVGTPPLLDDGGASLTQYPSCMDIGQSIYEATRVHRARQAALVAAMKAVVTARVALGSDGPRIRLRDLASIGVALEIATAEQAKSAVQLNVLAGLYTSYNCWQNGWPGAVGSTYVPTIPGTAKTCSTKTVEFELADGTTVQREITICEVRMQ